MAKIKHNGQSYDIPAGSTAEDTFESLKAAMPELSNAKLVKDGENYKTEVSYGKKG
ncbi:MAG: hypothetical protein WC454_10495 [Phycisphaerae bacterium]|jgi:UPF0288 family protein (methanogenesis marker protein 3)